MTAALVVFRRFISGMMRRRKTAIQMLLSMISSRLRFPTALYTGTLPDFYSIIS